MAEFAIVMHEMHRMCDAFYKKGNCADCRLYHNSVCDTRSNMDYEAIRKGEAAIMAWAAEHPEPKYPTWGEYLTKCIPHGSRETALTFAIYAMQQSIPADIAEKLEIKPKEG